jgi:hypothetical protein
MTTGEKVSSSGQVDPTRQVALIVFGDAKPLKPPDRPVDNLK